MYSKLQSVLCYLDSYHKTILLPQVIATILCKYNLPLQPSNVTMTINPNGTVSISTVQRYLL
jgi:hypothetical protein